MHIYFSLFFSYWMTITASILHHTLGNVFLEHAAYVIIWYYLLHVSILGLNVKHVFYFNYSA